MPPIVTRSTLTQTSKPVRDIASQLGKFNSAWDLTKDIKLLLYGRSGSGKTTTWASFPGPILALVCSGGNQPGELKSVDTPDLRKKITPLIIEQSQDIKPLLESDGAKFRTLVLDHASGLEDLVLKEILNLEELPAQKYWGLATQPQYGQCTLQCKDIMRSILNLRANVVIVAHERNFGGNEGGEVITPTVGAGLSPKLTSWLNGAVDYIGQTFIRNEYVTGTSTMAGRQVETREATGKKEYCLRTEPHEVYQTKFRIPLGRELPDVIVNPTYTKILELINGSPSS